IAVEIAAGSCHTRPHAPPEGSSCWDLHRRVRECERSVFRPVNAVDFAVTSAFWIGQVCSIPRRFDLRSTVRASQININFKHIKLPSQVFPANIIILFRLSHIGHIYMKINEKLIFEIYNSIWKPKHELAPIFSMRDEFKMHVAVSLDISHNIMLNYKFLPFSTACLAANAQDIHAMSEQSTRPMDDVVVFHPCTSLQDIRSIQRTRIINHQPSRGLATLKSYD
ncbi:Unknown protein, partial [Striga hermonthica]